jgi:hypothetical protein
MQELSYGPSEPYAVDDAYAYAREHHERLARLSGRPGTGYERDVLRDAFEMVDDGE